MNAVSANFDGVQNLSIEAKSLGTEYNTIQHAGLFSLLVMERMFSRTALLALPPMTFLASTDLFTRTRERISSSKREEKL